MEENFQIIKEKLNRISELQESHLEAFDKNLMPDLEKQCIERNNEFMVLKKMIDAFISSTGKKGDAASSEIFESFFPQLEILIGQSRELEKKVIFHRNTIQNSIRGVSRGKKVLGSYGASARISKGPRVLSTLN